MIRGKTDRKTFKAYSNWIHERVALKPENFRVSNLDNFQTRSYSNWQYPAVSNCEIFLNDFRRIVTIFRQLVKSIGYLFIAPPWDSSWPAFFFLASSKRSLWLVWPPETREKSLMNMWTRSLLLAPLVHRGHYETGGRLTAARYLSQRAVNPGTVYNPRRKSYLPKIVSENRLNRFSDPNGRYVRLRQSERSKLDQRRDRKSKYYSRMISQYQQIIIFWILKLFWIVG